MVAIGMSSLWWSMLLMSKRAKKVWLLPPSSHDCQRSAHKKHTKEEVGWTKQEPKRNGRSFANTWRPCLCTTHEGFIHKMYWYVMVFTSCARLSRLTHTHSHIHTYTYKIRDDALGPDPKNANVADLNPIWLASAIIESYGCGCVPSKCPQPQSICFIHKRYTITASSVTKSTRFARDDVAFGRK